MKFSKILLLLIIPLVVVALFSSNISSVSTVLLAIQGAITDGNLIKFSGTAGVGEDAGVAASKLSNITKDKFDATSAPTVNDDVDEGYTVGSKWYDVTADKGYVCLDNTDGTAVWTEITSLGTTTFTGLTDTPANYTGEAGKYAKVNVGEDALEFGTPAGYTNLTSFVEQTAWRLFYSNTDGDVVELALGDDGKYLMSNGAAVAPTWELVSGESNTASNIGTGVEIFKQKTGVDLEFRKIEAGSNQINISWYTEEGYVLTEEYSGDLTGPENIRGVNWWAQTFTTTSAYLVKKVALWVKKSGTPADGLHIAIRETSGGKPTGDDLVSITVSEGDVLDSYSWIEGIFATSYSLDDATLYAIVVTSPNSIDDSNCFQWTLKSGNPYGGGTVCSSTNSGSDWSILSDFDFLFKVYRSGVVYNDQVEIDVNEENIKLDDLGAPDDNTDNDASTTKHGLMPKLPFSGDLLSITTVAFNANADTTLYTVPTGKRCVLFHAVVVAAGDAGATTTVSIGQNTAETDFVPANTLSNLDAEYDSVILMPIPNTTPLKIKSYAADTVIEAQVASQSGVAGNTIYLFGILY